MKPGDREVHGKVALRCGGKGPHVVCEDALNPSGLHERRRINALCPFCVQKADGTCNTNFKKTKHREQVMEALEEFVGGNTQILVRWTPGARRSHRRAF